MAHLLGSSRPSLSLASLLSSADAATSPANASQVDVVGRQRMPVVALNLAAIDRHGATAPKRVLRCGGGFEVNRVHAGRIPAEVVYLQARRDRPERLFEREAMRPDLPRAVAESPVTVVRQLGSPEPTRAKPRCVIGNGAVSINLAPEASGKRHVASRCQRDSGVAVRPPAGIVLLAPRPPVIGPVAAIDRAGIIKGHRVTSGVARQGVLAPLPLSIVSNWGRR